MRENVPFKAYPKIRWREKKTYPIFRQWETPKGRSTPKGIPKNLEKKSNKIKDRLEKKIPQKSEMRGKNTLKIGGKRIKNRGLNKHLPPFSPRSKKKKKKHQILVRRIPKHPQRKTPNILELEKKDGKESTRNPNRKKRNTYPKIQIRVKIIPKISI